MGAVAAGNCVVLKPSESAAATAAILEKIVREVFEPDHVQVVQGAVETGKALLEQPWNYIFFTGGTAIGKMVAQAAAQHLTPVTLELGGKSPCQENGTSDRLGEIPQLWTDLYCARLPIGKSLL